MVNPQLGLLFHYVYPDSQFFLSICAAVSPSYQIQVVPAPGLTEKDYAINKNLGFGIYIHHSGRHRPIFGAPEASSAVV